ncbi:MAG: PEGA domain-containing protein [Alkalispirochaeta sp.]
MRPGKASLPRPQRAAVLLVLLVAVVATVAPRGTTEEEARARRADLLAELSEEDPVYTVAVAAIVAPDTGDRQRSIVSSYAEVLRDLATGPPLRYLDDEARRHVADTRIARYQRRLLREIDDRRNALERARLERTSPAGEIESDRADSSDDQQLRELRDQYELLTTISPNEVAIPREIPITVSDEDHRFRRTLPTAAGIAHELPEVDLMLYLSVEAVGDQLLLRVHSYDVSRAAERELFRVVGTAEDLSGRLESRERDVVAAIAGRDLGGIRVSVADPDGDVLPEARVFVGERYLGAAPAEDRYLPPGTYTTRSELPDGRRVSQTVEISAGTPQSVALVLRDEAPELVTIRSVPTGARVYRGSVWVGFTPVEVFRPQDDTSYTLVQDGFYDSRVTVTRDSASPIERTMVSADGDWAAEVEDSRDRFYRSFGFFALSVGVPILINGMYQNYAGLVDEGGALNADLAPAEQDRILSRTNALYYGYYASFGLSAGLFGNMIWRLVDYVQTAQGYHTR